MQKVLPTAIIICLLIAAGLVIYSTSFIANAYLSAKEQAKTKNCQATNTSYRVFIASGRASPTHTQAKLCDVLSIINHDSQSYLVTFGKHDAHQTYDGITEKLLNKGDILTVTLNQAGSFTFHDHWQDQVHGSFTVTQ
jgi:hypothetical protein